MYDFGEAQTGGSIVPDLLQLILKQSENNEKTIKAVFNNEGVLRIRAIWGSVTAESQKFTVTKRMRRYGGQEDSNFDFNQNDQAFADAADYWDGIYQYPLDDADRLKAIGMTESELGRNPTAPVTRPYDIMTIGNPGDHVLNILHADPGYVENEVDVPNNTVRTLKYPDAAAAPASTAILYGTCWLYHKAQTILNNPSPPPPLVPGPWKTWDDATLRYNGGGVPNYLDRVDRALDEGRHPVDAVTIWPIETNGLARP